MFSQALAGATTRATQRACRHTEGACSAERRQEQHHHGPARRHMHAKPKLVAKHRLRERHVVLSRIAQLVPHALCEEERADLLAIPYAPERR